MKCPKCNSNNVKIQAREQRPKVTVGFCIAFAGIGTLLMGIVGAIIGLVFGIVIGLILTSVLPSGYEGIMVCQDCGYVSQPMIKKNIGTECHPLFCSAEESNLDIIRNDIDKGTIIVVRIKVDEYPPFDMGDNSTTCLKLPNGIHTILYEQINGIGKAKNKGILSITIEDKKVMRISFSRQGLIVNLS